MLLRKNKMNVLDSVCYFPVIPDNIDLITVEGNQTVNHLKINYDSKYLSKNILYDITLFKEDGTLKTKEEIYAMMGSWDLSTLINAFFQKDFESGSISGSGNKIEKISIRRLSAESNYSKYETIGEVPYENDINDPMKDVILYFRDYLINSGEVYLYSIQPVIGKDIEVYGQIQNKIPALNTYQYTWIIDRSGNHIRLMDATLNSMPSNSKDAVIETFGSPYPYVNRYSNLNYRTFTLTGSIASVFDISNDILAQVDEEYFGTEITTREMVKAKMLEVYGESPVSIRNNMTLGSGYERKFRDKLVAILNDGKEKIFKSEAEGLMLVKFTNVSVIPKEALGRILYDFSLTVTEIGKVTADVIKDFSVFNKTGTERIYVL